MQKKVIILRALPWGKDSRVERWAKIYSNRKPLFGVWGKKQNDDDILSITNIIREPKNKFLIGIGYIWFSVKSFIFVLKNAKKNDVVVFIDLETVLLGWLAAFIKKAKIHYDIADPFYLVKPIPFKKFWKILESIYICKIRLVTVPHILRYKVFFNELKQNIQVVENVPIFQKELIITENFSLDGNITIGYFGGLEENYRGLENLAKIVLDDNRLKLIIAGSGNLSVFFENLSKKTDRIIFCGKFDSQDLPKLINDVDIYFAYYSDLKPLHKIAAPNKFYEHLFFGKPILTSNCIPQADDIKKYNTGWCIDNDEKALIDWKNSLFENKLNFMMYFHNCRNLWLDRYESYYKNLVFK